MTCFWRSAGDSTIASFLRRCAGSPGATGRSAKPASSKSTRQSDLSGPPLSLGNLLLLPDEGHLRRPQAVRMTIEDLAPGLRERFLVAGLVARHAQPEERFRL